MRLGSFVLPYSSIAKLTFHTKTMTDKDWMQITLNEQGMNLVPCGYICGPTFYLMVSHNFTNQTIAKITKMTENLEMEQVRARNLRIKKMKEKQSLSAAAIAESTEESKTENDEQQFTAAETEANETATEEPGSSFKKTSKVRFDL